MVMSRIWMGLLTVSILASLLTRSPVSLGSAALEGAQAGLQLGISMAGAICLWSGVAAVMEKCGISEGLARLFRPLLKRIFPYAWRDPGAAGAISANVCANLLGLGNAATPMGIRAVRRMKQGDTATDEMCRLVVLNTASIQLIPTNVAAVRSALGSASAFDILPAVWITSFCSAALGLLAARQMGRMWRG